MTYIMVYVTTKDEDEAKRIGETLVKERLAACANIIPGIRSVYWWKGEVESNGEAAIMLKSKQEKSQEIVKRVKELHSYDVPTIDIIPLSGGNPDCFEWLEESLKG
jgi:periplasmic divalent cation tolerance protein